MHPQIRCCVRRSKHWQIAWLTLSLPFCLALSAPGARATGFPKPFDTQVENIPIVPPSQAVGRFTLPPGFKATLFAGEPDVQQPMAITTDERGRLWVAENYTYSENPVNYHPDLDRDALYAMRYPAPGAPPSYPAPAVQAPQPARRPLTPLEQRSETSRAPTSAMSSPK